MTAKKSSVEKELINKVSKSKSTSKKTAPKQIETYNPFCIHDPERLTQVARCLTAATNLMSQLEAICVLSPSKAYIDDGFIHEDETTVPVFANADDAVEELLHVEKLFHLGRINYNHFPTIGALIVKARDLLKDSLIATEINEDQY